MFRLMLFWFVMGAAAPVTGLAAVSILDDSGARVALPGPARRIIPLYAALGESLAAMGLSDRIVAATLSDDSVPAALPRVGTHMRPNIEIITGLRPDLVVQFEGRAEAAQQAEALTRLGIPVARFRIASFDDLFACISRLGVLTGEEEKAEALIRDFRSRLDKVAAGTAGMTEKPSVFFEVRYPNLLGAGAGSMVGDIIARAGGRNSLSGYDERMVRLSEETLALLNPDIYLVQAGAMNKNPIPPRQRDHFRTLEAVAANQVFIVPESVYSRAGPKSVDAVEDLSRIVRDWHSRRATQLGRGSRTGLDNAAEKPHYRTPDFYRSIVF